MFSRSAVSILTVSLTVIPSTTLRGQSTRFRLALILICALGLGIRIFLHAGRAWLGDEWGSILALNDDYRSLLTHFGGWKTMNFYLVALKAISGLTLQPNWLLVAPSLLCGCWLIILAAAITLRLGGGARGALFAAALVATNPFLVYHSVEIRSYIFLATFSSAMLLCFLDWQTTGRLREGIACGIFGALALLMHLNGIYTLAAIGVLSLIWTVPRLARHEPDTWRRLAVLGVPAILLIGAVTAAYIPQMADIRTFRAKWSDTPPTALTFLPKTASLFFGEGYMVLPALGAILYAAWRVTHQRRPGQILLAAVVVPVAVISLAGVSHYPHAYARFLIAVLPWLLILIADALAAATSSWGRAASIAVVLAVVGGGLQSHRVAYRDLHAAPWDRISTALKQRMGPAGPCLVVGDPVNAVALQAYGVSAKTGIADTLAASPESQQCVVLLVDTARLLDGRPEVEHFGQLGLSRRIGKPRDIGEGICADLIAGTGGRIDPALVTPYVEIVQLLRWLGRADQAQAYQHLTALCRQHRKPLSLPQRRPRITPVLANDRAD